MNRLDDWPTLLMEEMERQSTMPFEYGVSDCMTMPLACVEAMTGERLWPDEWGPTTKIGAAKILLKHGFKTVGDAFASQFEEIDVPFAGRGDIGVIEVDDEVVGVVFVGPYAVGKSPDVGIVHVPRSRVTRAFRV